MKAASIRYSSRDVNQYLRWRQNHRNYRFKRKYFAIAKPSGLILNEHGKNNRTFFHWSEFKNIFGVFSEKKLATELRDYLTNS